MKRIPRAAGLLGWTLGAVALNAAVPRELSRLGDRAGRPAPAPPAARGAGLLMVAAGGALTAWAVAAHYQAAPRGWALESRPTPGYLLRTGPYQWSRNPMYAGEEAVWLGWALFYASPAVWAGLFIVSAAFTTLVPWEERWLLERFGEDYQAYLADVPRWVPRAPRRPRPADRRRFRATRDRNHQGGGGERALPLIMTCVQINVPSTPRSGRAGRADANGSPDQWHPEGVPCVTTLEELDRAAADFSVTDLGLVIEPPALAAARRSLEESGFLLLGEVHGVRENPLVIRSLMQAFGLTGLALEWHEDLAPAAGAFLAGGRLADHPLLWSGDGRITAGHLAVLRERAAAGPLRLTLFDGTIGAGWNWSQHDDAMARRILAPPAADTGTLVVAGNAHTPTTRTGPGTPLGACLARQRPGLREIRISYGGGRYYNIQPRRFRRRIGPLRRQVRLRQRRGSLVLDLPAAREAVVPQRPQPWPAGPRIE